MITPYARVQRGNSLTVARLRHFLSQCGFKIDLLSLEDDAWPERLQELLSQRDYQLLHGFHARHFGQVLATVPEVRNWPIILTTTGTDINYDLAGPHSHLVICAMSTAQKIVVFNEDFRLDLQARFPDWSAKLVTIPQGIFLEPGDPIARQDLGLSQDDFVLLLPSGLRPVKNIELAIDGLEGLHPDYPRIHLLIIGAVLDEAYAKPLLRRIRETNWITYWGEVPHESMRGLLSLGDVVLNTSYSEGQPQAALEAMSLGKPSILTAVPGNLNVMEDGREGFYVRDKTELAAAAKNLLDDPQLCLMMGQNARRLVETRFSLAQEIAAYRRLYVEIIGRP